MAHSDPDAPGAFQSALTEEFLDAQRAMNANLNRQITYLNTHPLPPLTRSERRRRELQLWWHDTLERVALRIAPWLDD